MAAPSDIVASPWAIVTGAGGALGGDLARRQALSGRRVLALDIDADRLRSLAEQSGVVTAAVDLTDEAAVQAALDAHLPRREPIALLVNAVGLIWNEPVLSLKGTSFVSHGAASFERCMRANVTTAFVCATRVAARMARTGGGAIVNFSSISAGGIAGQAGYSTAKAAIEGMTRAMAQELGPLGIRVNAVAPGFIDVPTTRAALAGEMIETYRRRTPLGRLGTLDELAEAVEMLARNSFMNGVVLGVDGGLRP